MKEQELLNLIATFPDQQNQVKASKLASKIPEKRAFELALPLLENTEGRERIAIVNLLSKKLNKKVLLAELLYIGLQKNLASEIGYWIEALSPKLGSRLIVALILKLEDKQCIQNAIYKLHFLPENLGAEVLENLKANGLTLN